MTEQGTAADTGPQTAAAVARRPVVVSRDASLRQVAAEMEDNAVSAVLVGRAPAWLVTERDLVGAVAAGATPDTGVDAVSSRDPVWISPTSSVHDAARMMAAHGVRHLVVIDADGKAVGMVDGLDLIKLLADALDASAGGGTAR